MPYFDRDNLEFHYRERGSGVPVFFQHGLGGETEKVFARIELPPGFRVLGMDCRGHRRISAPALVLANRRDPIHPFKCGQVLAREIPGAQFRELTPKSVNLARYTLDLRRNLAEFLQTRLC